MSAFNLYRPAAHQPAKPALTPPPLSHHPCLSPATLQAAQISLYSSATWSGKARTDWSRADTALYATGLADSAILKRTACKPETQAAKDCHLQELEQWLQQHSPRNLLTFLPADFEVYFTQHWVLTHGRSGQPPTLSTIAVTMSHLTGELDMLGREGPWHNDSG